MEAICSIREDIGREISRDTPKIPSNECQPWQEEVKRIVTEMNLIKEEFNENRRCLNGCCFPDICSCKKIVTMLDVVAKHQDASVFKGSMLVDALPVVVENVPLPLIKWGETAIDRYVQQIIQSLRGAKTREIRLWGMGGVGKTTLKSLNILLEIVQTFQVVLWVTVSKDWTVRKVQHEIAERLKIDIQDGKSNEFMVRRLLEKLSTMKYLLLLGDLWSLMNLEDVRVPLQNREIGNMETDEEIKVGRLVLSRSMELVSRKRL